MGFRSDGTIVDEASPVSLAEMIGHYKRSKFLAEQEAIRRPSGQAVVILNPTTPVGRERREADSDRRNHSSIFSIVSFRPMLIPDLTWSMCARWRARMRTH